MGLGAGAAARRENENGLVFSEGLLRRPLRPHFPVQVVDLERCDEHPRREAVPVSRPYSPWADPNTSFRACSPQVLAPFLGVQECWLVPPRSDLRAFPLAPWQNCDWRSLCRAEICRLDQEECPSGRKSLVSISRTRDKLWLGARRRLCGMGERTERARVVDLWAFARQPNLLFLC